jgi:hypothetical protein
MPGSACLGTRLQAAGALNNQHLGRKHRLGVDGRRLAIVFHRHADNIAIP